MKLDRDMITNKIMIWKDKFSYYTYYSNITKDEIYQKEWELKLIRKKKKKWNQSK